MADENKDNIIRLKGLREDYKKIFTTEEGKRVLKDLENICFYNTTTLSDKALMIAFNEGNRAVFLHIKTILELDIEALEKLSGGS